MQRIFFLCLFTIVLFGCKDAKEKNSIIKLNTDGLQAKGYYLAVAGQKVTTTEFAPGTKVFIVFDTVTGFIVADGRVSPGASMVLSKGRKELLNLPDLLAGYTAGMDSADVATKLELVLPLSADLEQETGYDWSVSVWDKNGKARMTANIPIKTVAPKDNIGIKYTSGGLRCSRVYISSDGPLVNNKVQLGQRLDFVFSGLEGFQVAADSTVSLAASVVVKNQAGEDILGYKDIFKDYGAINAIDAREIKAALTVTKPMQPGQVYIWIVKIYDKNNNNSMEASANIDVQK